MRALPLLRLLVAFAFPQGVALAVDAPPIPTVAEVANAYAAIPHQRTQFDASSSTAAANQKAALARLFAYTDRGVVLRVQGMKAHGAKDAAGLKRAMAGYDALIADLKREQFAGEVAQAQDLIIEALQLHQRHLRSRPEGGLVFAGQQISTVPEVKTASGKLLKAYDILMRAYPGETKRNKAAFYDHLCALDFL
jgi:hypothetical protein